MDAFAPKKATVSQAASSGSGHPIALLFGSGATPASAAVSAPLQARSESELTSHGDGLPREPSPRALAPIHRSPPVLDNEQGNVQLHVERLLQNRRIHGQNQYLVQWLGYSESYSSWEFEIPLRQDYPYAVDVFERHSQGRPAISDALHQ